MRSGGSVASAISERIRNAFSTGKKEKAPKRRMTIGGMGLAEVRVVYLLHYFTLFV